MKTTLEVSRGFTYSYIKLKPDTKNPKPYLLFLHGFPSLAHEWHYQIDYFFGLGYGIIAPDLLGFGETSHPLEVNDYRLKLIAQDLVDILDHEGIDKVQGIAHDFGVLLLSRMEFYHPSRFIKLAFLAVGYAPMGSGVDLDAANGMSKKMFGYSTTGYISFFVEDQSAVEVINRHPDAMASIFFAEDNELLKSNLGDIGGLKKWLLEDRRTKSVRGLTEEDKAIHALSFQQGTGYASPLMWYKCFFAGISAQDENTPAHTAYVLGKPLLLLLTAKCPLGIPAIQLSNTKPYAPHLTSRELQTGHWLHLEAHDVVNAELRQFLEN